MATITPELPLGGLRLLVTRPQAQAKGWQQLLQSQGASCVAVPLMAIVALADVESQQAIEHRIQDLHYYQHVIFVSQNAVAYAASRIKHHWASLPQGVNFYAVGSATANSLRAEGFPVSEAGNTMNSEALLALPDLQTVKGQKVLICRGRGGRPLLADVLSQRGAIVDYCELYERQFPSQAAQQIAALDWGQTDDLVAVHSGEALDNWYSLIEKQPSMQWLQLPVVVPGARVAKKAAALGFTCTIEAYNASDQAMLEALIDWRQQQN
ncbi:uroporphyrinogen-III synthase [Maricurvus nonylphenolicus]|uniref:uroporphyrinogen-III synthase n=1 Tax=Maricurvus nonylphenolicus TaxID=1008307 RepID=UPI0036F20548